MLQAARAAPSMIATSLVLAETNVAGSRSADELRAAGVPVAKVGDCLAPRHAPAARPMRAGAATPAI